MYAYYDNGGGIGIYFDPNAGVGTGDRVNYYTVRDPMDMVGTGVHAVTGSNMGSSNTPCNCFAGTPVIDASGNCGCTQPTAGNPNVTPQQQPVAGFDLISLLQAHPEATLIGIGVLAYFLFIKK